MEKFHIILIPQNRKELIYEFEHSCQNVDAACDFAKVTLVMNGGRYREARILSRWKSDLSFREAVDPIIFNNNL